jgi:type IX secretion system PorP/SprF family membrane protein
LIYSIVNIMCCNFQSAFKKVFVIILFVIIYNNSNSQTFNYSQFYASPIYLNPAFAGITFTNKLSINYRKQYPNLNQSYTNYNVAFDKYFKRLNGGLGLILISESEFGKTLQRQSVHLNYAYHNDINAKTSFSFSMQAGYVLQSIKYNQLTVQSQINNNDGTILGPISSFENLPANQSNSFLDINSGLLAYHENFYAGVCVKHLNSPKVGFQKELNLARSINVHGGYIFKEKSYVSKDVWYFTPNFLFATQNKFSQINLGFYAGKEHYYGGIAVRNNLTNFDALIFIIGFKYNNLRIGYSYDLNLSTKTIIPRIAHELSLVWVFDNKLKSVKDIKSVPKGGRIKCPKFFK